MEADHAVHISRLSHQPQCADFIVLSPPCMTSRRQTLGWVAMSERDGERIRVLSEVLAGRRTVDGGGTACAVVRPIGRSRLSIGIARQIDRDGRWTIKRGCKQTPPPGEVQRQTVGEIAVPVFGYKKPSWHRSDARLHPPLHRHPRGTARRQPTRRTARYRQCSEWCVGRYRLSQQGQPATAGSAPSNAAFQRPNRVASRYRHTSPAATRRGHRYAPASSMCSPRRSMAWDWSCVTVGQLRATAKIALANLIYNMRRLVWIEAAATPLDRAEQHSLIGHHRYTNTRAAPRSRRSGYPPAVIRSVHQRIKNRVRTQFGETVYNLIRHCIRSDPAGTA